MKECIWALHQDDRDGEWDQPDSKDRFDLAEKMKNHLAELFALNLSQ